MDAETINRLCAEALQRLAYHINRSAGQHLRRMREQLNNPTKTERK